MKIGIISMQRVPNYGSFLQAYGLKNTLEELGNEVLFLDYKPEPPVGKYSKLYYFLWKVKNIPIVNGFIDTVKYKCLKRRDFSLLYKKFFLPKLGVGYKCNYREKVDLAVIGSDEVFNCVQSGFNVGYSSMLLGDNIKANKVVSYAASFGYTTEDLLDEYGIKNDVVNKMSKIDKLSVRDENSLQLMQKFFPGKEVSFNYDPVLISNYNVDDIKVEYSNYVLLYTYKSRYYSDEEIGLIKEFCKKHNKKLVSLGDYKEWADIKMVVSPLEVLAYVKNADFVITDTFHGTVFSLKMNTPFATKVRQDNKQKLTSLLHEFNLENCIIENYFDLEKVFKKSVEFSFVNEIIDREMGRTRDYFKQIMKECMCVRN